MAHPSLVKPTHKAIQAYYQTLKEYGEHERGQAERDQVGSESGG
jgi:hypothetical protein